jgi:hypothetical protein
MADIYQNAYLTLAASHSKDSNGGLFASTQILSKRLTEHREFYAIQRIRFPKGYPDAWTDEVVENWPLFPRALAYQERKVSPCIVYFASHQVYLECNSRLLSEDGEYEEDYTVGSESKRDFVRRLLLASYTGDPVRDWQGLITEFSKLKLTFETDRLPPVAALAQRMRTFRRNDIHVASMWENSMLTDLCWHSTHPHSHTRSVRAAPTWSWATISGNIVNWSWSKNARLIRTVKLLDLSFTSVGPANVGDVTDARLIVKAPFISANLTEGFRIADSRKSLIIAIAVSFQTSLPGGLSNVYNPWSTYADLDHNDPFLSASTRTQE